MNLFFSSGFLDDLDETDWKLQRFQALPLEDSRKRQASEPNLAMPRSDASWPGRLVFLDCWGCFFFFFFCCFFFFLGGGVMFFLFSFFGVELWGVEGLFCWCLLLFFWSLLKGIIVFWFLLVIVVLKLGYLACFWFLMFFWIFGQDDQWWLFFDLFHAWANPRSREESFNSRWGVFPVFFGGLEVYYYKKQLEATNKI